MYILDIDKSNKASPIIKDNINNGIASASEIDTKNVILSAPKNDNNIDIVKMDNDIGDIGAIGTAKTDNNISVAKTAYTYVLLAIFCALFGGIYERFSHGVYSFFMIYAFAFPLVGGALPFFTIFLTKSNIYPYTAARNFYHSGIATLTVGSILLGVLDIYGTTNSLMLFYWIAGVSLTVLGVIIYGLQTVIRKTPEKSNKIGTSK